MQYTVPLLCPCPYTNKTNKDGSASLLEYFFLGCGIERAHISADEIFEKSIRSHFIRVQLKCDL